MRLVRPLVAAWRPPFLLLSLLSLLCASAFDSSFALADAPPAMAVSRFGHPPVNLRYFPGSDVVLFHDDEAGNVYHSPDAGRSWSRIDALPPAMAVALVLHPFHPETAFILTPSGSHVKTEDRGKSWHKFRSGALPSKLRPETLVFHAGDPSRIIFNAMKCDGIFCQEFALYTTDSFKSAHLLRSYTVGCWWARTTPEFTTGSPDLDKSRVLCVVKDPFSLFRQDQRIVYSDTFFAVVGNKIQESEPDMDAQKGVSGVLNLAAVKKFIVVATATPRSDDLALYVSQDTTHWHRAIFPVDDSHGHSHQLSQGAYTVLEGTNYSVQIDVLASRPSHPMGVLFTSNSNGTYFTENIPFTNRNRKGRVDFEKISGLLGIFLLNVVENGPQVAKSGADKVVVSQITFDDGRTFHPIHAGSDRLHLHSVTELDNIGRVFSSPAPGLVMGNGNTGKALGPFADANLFVSDDAGFTWKKALDGPHKYEFGDSGSVLLAVRDSRKEDVKEYSYSLDHGDTWKQVAFPDNLAIKPIFLTTTPDSTSLKFLLLGQQGDEYHLVAIDLDGLHQRTCRDDDLEDWHPRLDDKGNPICIMGIKQTYRRRKKSADCFLKEEFKNLEAKTEKCQCTDADFECDYNFERDPTDATKCNRIGPVPVPDDGCRKDPQGTFRGSSGWRLIPGNMCERPSGKQKDEPTEHKCSEGISPPQSPASGKVISKQFIFDSDLKDFQKLYLERSGASSANDETVIVRPSEDHGDGEFKVENRLWISHDHGKEWKRILEGEKIEGIYAHLYFKDVVFFTTNHEKVIYTIDRGRSFHKFKPPSKAIDEMPLGFHPDKKDWLIWMGKRCERVGGSETCFREASVSTDRGDNWKTLQRYVEKCEFTGNTAYTFRPLKQIVCLVRKEERNDAPLTVVSSNDFFDEDKFTYGGEVANFATMNEFIVLAGEDKKTKELLARASLDGKNFDAAQFPYNFHKGHNSQYTLLDSSTHAINLFVRTEGGADRQFGSIVKSNSNGTSYVLSAANVNCNEQMYVDFEKVSGLEGVTLINVVTNADDASAKKKLLQTKISHNDGSEWAYLAPPTADVDGNPYSCTSRRGDQDCALHLHHYTERDDKRRTFAADTSVGLLFGVGNVGSTLGDIREADTFMTTDGGVSWRSVKKGHWTWQYGDQGSIIVLVQRATRAKPVKTKIVSYSLDEGKTWQDYQFADDEVTVLDLTTLRSGTSRNFLLWCRSNQGKMFSVNLDFTGLADKACDFKRESPDDSDYFLWSPKHPLQDDDCLFGHVAKYLRKKADRKCYNDQSLKRLYEYKNCACSRRDYECAYNYELDGHGQCQLVSGLEPLSGKEWCSQNPNETSWFEPTGYRRVPLSTCEGGNELDKTSTEHPCEGHEAEFEKKHRTPAVVIFFAVAIPCAAAVAVGWYVYRNWDGKFGQIRLGEQTSTFDSDRPWIKYPVIALSAVVALAATLPLIATRLWHWATRGFFEGAAAGRQGRWFARGPRRFTTRDSFARRGPDYAIVDDEGELLGEESDEEP